MSEPKTRPTPASVDGFIAAIADQQKRRDCEVLARLMQAVTGERPVLWGNSIVGFGRCRYRYASGREGDWPLVGFSPRKRELTVYIMSGFDQHSDLLARLGKHRTGSSCLYLKHLDGVDMEALAALVSASVREMRHRYLPARPLQPSPWPATPLAVAERGSHHSCHFDTQSASGGVVSGTCMAASIGAHLGSSRNGCQTVLLRRSSVSA